MAVTKRRYIAAKAFHMHFTFSIQQYTHITTTCIWLKSSTKSSLLVFQQSIEYSSTKIELTIINQSAISTRRLSSNQQPQIQKINSNKTFQQFRERHLIKIKTMRNLPQPYTTSSLHCKQ